MAVQQGQPEPIKPRYTGTVKGQLGRVNPYTDRISLEINGQEYFCTMKMAARAIDLFKKGEQVEAVVKEGWIFSLDPAGPTQEAML